jgi:asparagine synthase (glutamine-hydrolysing)
MCGILGAININFDNAELDLIRHRGPDGAGIVTLPIGRHTITLGHRRLSIVDLSPAGDQPMQTEDGRFLITYNGEVYNHSNLRAELGDISFKGHSDTETVLYYLSRKGIDAIRHLNGIFAIGLVDIDAAALYLIRDPFGVKPLYYWAKGNSLIFSSEIKPIQRIVHDTFNVDHLSSLLTLRYLPSPITLFNSIKKVRPGHVIKVDLHDANLKVTEFSYIDETPEKLKISFVDAENEYGRLLEQSINRQLMSDVEIGILLSGGIDSAIIAKCAQNNTGYRMKAFTVGFDGDSEADEVADARRTADIIGLDHHTVNMDFEDFLQNLKKCIDIVEEPIATTSMVPMFFLTELASRHVKVVFAGQGADEPLGGYGRYQGELLQKYVPKSMIPLLRSLFRKLNIQNDQVNRFLNSAAWDNDIKRFQKIYEVFKPQEIESLIGNYNPQTELALQYFYDLLGCRKLEQSVDRMMALDTRMNLSDDLLLYTDKISMQHSLECRVPMLDLELIRFIESLPTHYRVKLRNGKIIHKKFASNYLPSEIVHRKKKGFLSPTADWFLKKREITDILLNPDSVFARYFNLSAVNKVMQEHQLGFNRERQIFLLLGIHFGMESIVKN